MKGEHRTKVTLDDAILAYRSFAHPDDRLPDEARAEIVRAATRPDRESPRLPQLFVPWGRWATVAAALLPAAILAGVLGWPTMEPPQPVEPGTLKVSKKGDQVVFTIANGDREHRVQVSDRPDRFDRSGEVRLAGGEYVDQLEQGSSIVFYRID